MKNEEILFERKAKFCGNIFEGSYSGKLTLTNKHLVFEKPGGSSIILNINEIKNVILSQGHHLIIWGRNITTTFPMSKEYNFQFDNLDDPPTLKRLIEELQPHKTKKVRKKIVKKIIIDAIKCPFCERLIPEDSEVCPYCKKDLEVFNNMKKLMEKKFELKEQLENLKKRKEELIREGVITEEIYQQRYNVIMDQLVDIEDKVIQEKMKGGKKK